MWHNKDQGGFCHYGKGQRDGGEDQGRKNLEGKEGGDNICVQAVLGDTRFMVQL